jgi:membrane protease YdiL (CAAX protease family)
VPTPSPVDRAAPFWRDPPFFLSLGLGAVAWLLPAPAGQLSLASIVLKAGIEEAFFRWGLQAALSTRLTRRLFLGLVSPANLATSAVFALVHLLGQPPAWALATFLPSLVFGWQWDRYRRLAPCALTHAAYNILFFYRP